MATSAAAAAAATSLPLPKERLVRVICTDPDATDSSSDDEEAEAEEEKEEEEEEIELEVGGRAEKGKEEEGLNPQKRRRLVREICLLAAPPSPESALSAEICGENDESPRAARKKKTTKKQKQKQKPQQEKQKEEEAEEAGGGHLLRIFPAAELCLLPEDGGDGGDEVWGESSWDLPEDDSIFEDVSLHFGSPWPLPLSAESIPFFSF
jgi:hypothetical protein